MVLSLTKEKKISIDIVGFDVITVVVMQTSMFWDITTYGLLKVN
jgi:hypothetical protein